MKLIKQNDVLQAHPEFLNEQIDDHDKAIYAKGWNDCNKEYYNAITELPVAPMACTDLSTRLRRAFEADELVNQRLLLDAADAIEELLITTSAQKETIEVLRARNSAQADMLDGEWISVEERLPEENYAVLGYCQKNQCVFTVFRQGEHWMHFAEHTTPVFYPVTHWMQLPESPKEVE